MIDTAELRQLVRRAAETVRGALLWWTDELWHLLPPRLRAALSADPIAVEIRLPDPGREEQAVAIETLRSGRLTRSRHLEDWRAALAWAARQRRRWGPLLSVDLVLPAAGCLIREREIPAAAGHRVRDVLALELERTTPFRPQDVRHAWRTAGGPGTPGSLAVQHVVAKRHLSDPVLAEARALGLPVAAVDVMDGTGSRMGLNLLERAEAPRSLSARLNRLIAIAAGLAMLAAATAAVVAVQRQEEALARLQTDVHAARKEARAVRQRLKDAENLFERIGRLRQRRTDDAGLIALWEEMTRRLPDTAWLTDMRLEDQVLWLDGYARSASELVRTVAQSPMVSGVALSAPVRREPEKGGERFQLRIQIAKPGPPGPPATGPERQR